MNGCDCPLCSLSFDTEELWARHYDEIHREGREPVLIGQVLNPEFLRGMTAQIEGVQKSFNEFGEAAATVTNGPLRPLRAARNTAHVFVRSGPLAGATCGKCGLGKSAKIHQVPPAAAAPKLTKVQMGDRVICEDMATLTFSKLGTVVGEIRDSAGVQTSLHVELDEDNRIGHGPGPRKVFPVSSVRLAVRVPTFATVEEADAWLEAQRLAGQ